MLYRMNHFVHVSQLLAIILGAYMIHRTEGPDYKPAAKTTGIVSVLEDRLNSTDSPLRLTSTTLITTSACCQAWPHWDF